MLRQSPKPRTNPQSGQRRRKAEDLESEIAMLEQQLAEVTAEIANPAPDWAHEKYAEISARQHQLHEQLEALYAKWEATSAEQG